MESISTTAATATFITPEEVLQHWQGHRDLTRRLIVAFPEEQLFNYSIGGMRTFAEMAQELISIAAPGVIGIVKGTWEKLDHERPSFSSKKELLERWDEATEVINEYWPKIKPERFHEQEKAFGQYDGTVYSSILYFIDNEIHHRGQGYVYLRSLGIEPPFFWDRP